MAGRDAKRGREAGEFANIKQLFEHARSELHVGELLASPTFDLQTAMSAREIGDPKMDRCGLASDVETRSCAERIADGEGRLDLREPEVLAIMDRLLQMEIGWHDRYLLCQTVYTSLYVSSVARIRDVLPDLYAYCLSVDALSSYLYDAVYSNRVCCDEDVSVILCGVSLCETGVDDVLSVLEDRLEVHGASPQDPIIQRLRWRHATLSAMLKMARSSNAKDLGDVARSCDEAIAMLDAIEFLDDASVEQAEGFVPTLYYATLGHAPIRDVALRSMWESVEAWKSFMLSLKEAACLLARVHSWPSLKSFLDHIATRDYHGFIRCLVYHLMIHQPNAAWAPSQRMLARDILLMGELDEEKLSEQLQSLPELETFFEQCVLALHAVCHVKCLNRARQHRRLRHTLRDWMNMLGHAFNAETASGYEAWIQEIGFAWDESSNESVPAHPVRIAPLTSWVVYETAWTCIEHLLMGGPLELYQQPWEISTVFWYVSYLMGSAEDAAKEYANVSRTKRRGMRSTSHSSRPDDDIRHRTDSSLRAQVHDVLQMAVDSISMTSIALQSMGMSMDIKREFNEGKDSFDQRFGFMAELEFPRHQSYEDYRAYEQNVVGFASCNPKKLVEESSFYTSIVYKRLVSVAERVGVLEELHLSEHVWAALQRTLVANMTALKLLVTLLGRSEDTRDISSQYSVSWRFDEDADDATTSQSKESGFALVCVTLPKLVVARK